MSATTKIKLVIYEGGLWSLRTYPNSSYCCTTLVLVPPLGLKDPRKLHRSCRIQGQLSSSIIVGFFQFSVYRHKVHLALHPYTSDNVAFESYRGKATYRLCGPRSSQFCRFPSPSKLTRSDTSSSSNLDLNLPNTLKMPLQAGQA